MLAHSQSDSTFLRLFGGGHDSGPSTVREPVFLLSGARTISPEPADRRPAQRAREDFGIGFMRAAAVFSPMRDTRTQCVQDILLRDKTGVNADMPPPERHNQSLNVTSTTHNRKLQTNNVVQ